MAGPQRFEYFASGSTTFIRRMALAFRMCRLRFGWCESTAEELRMSESLAEIAKRVEAQPWNRPGTDKTWVLNAMADQLRFRAEVRKSKRVG